MLPSKSALPAWWTRPRFINFTAARRAAWTLGRRRRLTPSPPRAIIWVERSLRALASRRRRSSSARPSCRGWTYIARPPPSAKTRYIRFNPVSCLVTSGWWRNGRSLPGRTGTEDESHRHRRAGRDHRAGDESDRDHRPVADVGWVEDRVGVD